MQKSKCKKLIIFVVIPLAVGGLSSLITSGAMKGYANLRQPPFSPPGFLFPIVWTVLFVLMGISMYLVDAADGRAEAQKSALVLWSVQLAVNFFWPLLFFSLNAFLPAFFLLIILWLLVLFMIVGFSKLSKTAAILQLPYILWLTFAGYLNLAVYFLNRAAG